MNKFMCNLYMASHCYHHAYSDAIRYSFGHLIQSELDRFAEEWNSHRSHTWRNYPMVYPKSYTTLQLFMVYYIHNRVTTDNSMMHDAQ